MTELGSFADTEAAFFESGGEAELTENDTETATDVEECSAAPM